MCIGTGDRPLTGKNGQCLAFNRKGGCKNRGKCPNGKHICTVCGSKDHGASYHTPSPTNTETVVKKRVIDELTDNFGEMSAAEKAKILRKDRSDKS